MTAKKKNRLNSAAEEPQLPAAAYTRNLTESTFGDFGQRLPVGVLQGGELHREFSFRRFTMREERKLEELRRSRKKTQMVDFIAGILAHMLTKLGPYDFETLTPMERRLVVNQMWHPDAMYAYIWLRIEALGPECVFSLTCTTCEHQWKWTADLNRTDVTSAESAADIVYPYKLRDGIETPEGLFHDVNIQPARWSAMSAVNVKGGINLADVKLHMMASAIRRVEEGKHPISREMLETLTKYDSEMLYRAIDEMTPGPDLTLEVECPECGHEFLHLMDWSWDFFFRGSSLSAAPTN